MSQAVAWWQRHWFTPAPLADLGVGRVVLVVLVLLLGTDRYVRTGRASDQLWDPVGALVLLGVDKPGPDTVVWLAWITICLLVFVGIGLFTRIALACLVPLLFFEDALVMSFGKTSHATIPVLWAFLFFAMSPCDRRLSVDAWIRRSRGNDPGPDASPYARWPIELLYVVLSAFYFSAGLSKLRVSGLRWADGSTLQYHLLHKQIPLGLELAELPWLCAAASTLVLLWQLGFPLGLHRRFRPFCLMGGLAFHIGTGLFMDIWFWPVPVLYLLFVPWTRITPAGADRAAAYSPGSSPPP